MKLFIRHEDIHALCDPCKDEEVKVYTEQEIAEEYFSQRMPQYVELVLRGALVTCCKDCVYWTPTTDEWGGCDIHAMRAWSDIDYCSYAERKDDTKT